MFSHGGRLCPVRAGLGTYGGSVVHMYSRRIGSGCTEFSRDVRSKKEREPTVLRPVKVQTSSEHFMKIGSV